MAIINLLQTAHDSIPHIRKIWDNRKSFTSQYAEFCTAIAAHQDAAIINDRISKGWNEEDNDGAAQLSHEEIAQLIGCEPGTVKNDISQLRKSLPGYEAFGPVLHSKGDLHSLNFPLLLRIIEDGKKAEAEAKAKAEKSVEPVSEYISFRRSDLDQLVPTLNGLVSQIGKERKICCINLCVMYDSSF